MTVRHADISGRRSGYILARRICSSEQARGESTGPSRSPEYASAKLTKHALSGCPRVASKSAASFRLARWIGLHSGMVAISKPSGLQIAQFVSIFLIATLAKDKWCESSSSLVIAGIMFACDALGPEVRASIALPLTLGGIFSLRNFVS